MEKLKQILGMAVAILIMSLGVGSCSQAEDELLPKTSQEVKQTTKVSVEEAVSRANTLLSEIEGTRSYVRAVESVQAVGRSLTRSEEAGDTLLYLINYKDGNGFALMGSDERMNSVYAISDKGHLEMTDTVDNPGLKDFLQKAHMHAALASSDPVVPVYPTDYQYIISDQVRPLLYPDVSEWHQGAPYNRYCRTKNGIQASVGCGPLCIASLLAYYESEYPSPIVWDYIDKNNPKLSFSATWDVLADQALEDEATMDLLAKALWALGQDDYLQAKYQTFSTDVNSDRFLPTMVSRAYLNENVFYETSFKENVESVLSFLKRGKDEFMAAPLIFWGVNSKTKGSPHFWIVDGYVKRSRKPAWQGNPSELLLHCVWGQQSVSGFQNGYFLYLKDSDLFNTEEKIPTGGTGVTIPYTYTDLLVIGGYRS